MSNASNLAGFVTSIVPNNNLNVGIVTATTLNVGIITATTISGLPSGYNDLDNMLFS